MIAEANEKSKSQLVYRLVRASRCYNCDAKLEQGTIVKLLHADEQRELFCAICAGLESLEFLPGKNAKLTNLAKKMSKQSFIVMQWSSLWKAYERQGLLVEAEALTKAKSKLNASADY